MNRIITAKFGSRSLLDKNDTGEKRLSLETIDEIAYDVLSIQKNIGDRVMLVTSGAVVSGTEIIEHAVNIHDSDLLGKLFSNEPNQINREDLFIRMASSVGQLDLTSFYRQAYWEAYLKIFGQEPPKDKRFVSQICPTPADLADGARGNVAKTLLGLMELGITPLVNGNDATSGYNLVTGDNDQMAAMLVLEMKKVLGNLGRDDELMLALFTDRDGVYDGNPDHEDSRIIEILRPGEELDGLIEKAKQYLKEHQEEMTAQGKKIDGTGSMASKLGAAKSLAENGIPVFIGKWESGVLEAIAKGENVKGTWVLPEGA